MPSGQLLRRDDISRTTDYRHTSNGSAVLQAVLDHGPVARSTIARLVGVSPAAVTRLSADLITAGLLRESAPVAARPKPVGRPHVPVEIDTTRRAALGLHIALRHATLALLDLRGRVLASERIAHADTGTGTGPRRVLSRLAARVPGFAAEHAGGQVLAGLGIATGGWVDRDDGVIIEHAPLGWRAVPAARVFADATGLPVRVDNHARALARAEQLFGDPRARASVVHLFVGNTVDAAFATGGSVHHGPQSAAGAIAHLPLKGRSERCACGRRGCLQAVVGSHELAVRAAREGVIDDASFGRLLGAARDGDPRAAALLRERARLLGTAAALLVDLLNPDLLVVTEQGIRHVPGCLEILRAEVGERSRLCADAGQSVVTPSFGDESLPVAAGTVMLDALYANPLGHQNAVSRETGS
ncbi:MAG TPA: ROK family protein [Trebonia sp.]|jgi:predicted NBD/HSP70 family sugar kinase|nr:ROK family protein [Trebonia sp.]